MIKVVKDNNKKFNIICNNCNSELQYTNNDIINQNYVEEYYGDLYCVYKKYIKCPLCKAKIILDIRTN